MATPLALITPMQRAVDACGSAVALGQRLGVTGQAVRLWVRRGFPPASRVLQIEAATEIQVTRYELRPDLYPRGRVPPPLSEAEA